MTLRAMWDALSAWPAGLRLWGEAVSDALDAPSSAVPGTKRSVTVDGGDLQLVGDADAPGASKRYGTDSEGVRGWQDADDAPPGVKGSLEVDGGDLQLVGDEDNPDPHRVYGTDSEGVRGWRPPPPTTIVHQLADRSWSHEVPARDAESPRYELRGWDDPADATHGIATPANLDDLDVWLDLNDYGITPPWEV